MTSGAAADAFEVVGVELNEARNKKITFQNQRHRQRSLALPRCPGSGHLERPWPPSRVPIHAQNQPGVGDEHFGHDFSILVDEPPLPPHGADDGDIVRQMYPNKVCAQARKNFTAVVKTAYACWNAGHHADSRRQVNIEFRPVCQQKGAIQHGARYIIRGQDVYQSLGKQFGQRPHCPTVIRHAAHSVHPQQSTWIAPCASPGAASMLTGNSATRTPSPCAMRICSTVRSS